MPVNMNATNYNTANQLPIARSVVVSSNMEVEQNSNPGNSNIQSAPQVQGATIVQAQPQPQGPPGIQAQPGNQPVQAQPVQAAPVQDPAGEQRQELIVRKGVYKGRRGYVDTTRGNNGYSPSGKSVYITYFDDNGVLRTTQNYIRTSSVDLVSWSLPRQVAESHPYLENNSDVGMRIAEFGAAIRSITFPDAETANRFRNDVISMLDQLIPPQGQ